MGLYKGDLEKVPENLSVRDCYERIYRWHMKYGLDEVLKPDSIGRRVNAEDLLAYRDLWGYFHGFNPGVASQQDMDLIFMEVITGLLEWSYHREDEFGIKMAAYAQFAINKKYGNLQNKEFMRSCMESKLLKYFLDLEDNRSKYWKRHREL